MSRVYLYDTLTGLGKVITNPRADGETPADLADNLRLLPIIETPPEDHDPATRRAVRHESVITSGPDGEPVNFTIWHEIENRDPAEIEQAIRDACTASIREATGDIPSQLRLLMTGIVLLRRSMAGDATALPALDSLIGSVGAAVVAREAVRDQLLEDLREGIVPDLRTVDWSGGAG
jgi:hypothetical protein